MRPGADLEDAHDGDLQGDDRARDEADADVIGAGVHRGAAPSFSRLREKSLPRDLIRGGAAERGRMREGAARAAIGAETSTPLIRPDFVGPPSSASGRRKGAAHHHLLCVPSILPSSASLVKGTKGTMRPL